jgi:Tfp pilus assembly protein PilF
MRFFLPLTLALLTSTSFGQQMTSDDWKQQSKTNIRLLPKYGLVKKTEHQKESDKKFISDTIEQEQFKGNNKNASNHMIMLGFTYLNRGDSKTAMYRFNQAYLLDSTNVEIYWGYGAFFMSIGSYGEAAMQYVEGLKLEPTNTHLLTDYGTYFMAQYYGLQPIDKTEALMNVDSAISYMTRSYKLDKGDMNTTYKLSICSWLKGDCDNAWQYYDECKALGGQPITEGYTNDLTKKCRRKK